MISSDELAEELSDEDDTTPNGDKLQADKFSTGGFQDFHMRAATKHAHIHRVCFFLFILFFIFWGGGIEFNCKVLWSSAVAVQGRRMRERRGPASTFACNRCFGKS